MSHLLRRGCILGIVQERVAPTREPAASEHVPARSEGSAGPTSSRTLAAATALGIQAKLEVGAADDPLEREADRIAADVVASIRRSAEPLDTERVPAQLVAAVSRMPSVSRVHRAADPVVGVEGGTIGGGLESRVRSSTGGRPLDPVLRAPMERAFGADLGSVRVHTDSRVAPSIGAKAFTHGDHVHFAPGAYDPGSPQGQHLVAHEITHTLQQGGGRARRAVSSSVVPEVQRAAGLPTKGDAKAAGQQAGFHFGFGKTSFGKLLDELDAFAALNEADHAGKLAKIVKIQALVTTWLESDKRTAEMSAKKQASDEDKQRFLGGLLAKTKVLYHELVDKAGTTDQATTDAATHAPANRARIEAELKLKNLLHSKQQIDAILARVASARLTTNFTAGTIGFLEKDPYFKNFWQINVAGYGGGKSPGGALSADHSERTGSQDREFAERYLGYKPFTEVQRVNRPAYCGVNIFNLDKGAAATGYGPFHFIWKDRVKQRATYTARDTFEMTYGGLKDVPSEEAIASNDNLEATLAFNSEALLALAYLEEGYAQEAAEMQAKAKFYIEAQVHGGLSMDDVDEFVVPFAEDSTGPGDMNNANRDAVKSLAALYNLTVRWNG